MSISTIEAFSPAERAKLRDAGIVVFANRFIFGAQPPMPPHEAAELQAKCAGPIPRDLLDLWAETAGGNLAYDLPRVPMLGRMEALSFEQLFHPGGDGYNDLRYWVDEALEARADRAETSGVPWDGRLEILPFGGFESTNRMYAVVGPGATHGRVLAWKMGRSSGLPEDCLVEAWPSVRALFASLYLEEDPLLCTDGTATGIPFLEYLEECVEERRLGRRLSERVAVAFAGCRLGGLP